jgi:hypothetical protein
MVGFHEVGSGPIMELRIDSRLVANGSVVEYDVRVVGFSQEKGLTSMRIYSIYHDILLGWGNWP